MVALQWNFAFELKFGLYEWNDDGTQKRRLRDGAKVSVQALPSLTGPYRGSTPNHRPVKFVCPKTLVRACIRLWCRAFDRSGCLPAKTGIAQRTSGGFFVERRILYESECNVLIILHGGLLRADHQDVV